MDRMSGGEPAMHFEAPPTPEMSSADEERRVEKDQPAAQETAPSKAPSNPTQTLPPITLPTVPTPTLPDDQTQHKPVAPPVITASLHATDGHLIEKEWVDAAKMVIAKTSNDPFKQKQEFSRIKTDYQMKRFNKRPSDDAVAA